MFDAHISVYFIQCCHSLVYILSDALHLIHSLVYRPTTFDKYSLVYPQYDAYSGMYTPSDSLVYT